MLWTVEEDQKGKIIIISFEKLYKLVWWDYVIQNDEILYSAKIQSDTCKLSDIDESLRPGSKYNCIKCILVEKLIYDTQMKAMGMPTSSNSKVKSELDKFVKSHPEMDFSKAKFCT